MGSMHTIDKPKRWYGRELRGVDIPTAKTPKIPYVIKPLLIKGESLLIHGPQQCGKSTLTWNMARAIGAGQNFLGLDTMKGQVLYVEADVQQETALPRLQVLGEMEGVTFHFLPGSCNLLAPHPALLETLQWYQKTLQPDVVIFNTLRKIYSGDSKDDEVPGKLMSAVRHIFPGAAQVYNHHDVKRRFGDRGELLGSQEESFAGSKAWINDIGGSLHILPEPDIADEGAPKSSRLFHNKNQAGRCLPPFKILLPDGSNVTPEWPSSWIDERCREAFGWALKAGQGAAEFDSYMASRWGGPPTRYRDLRGRMRLFFPKGAAK